MSSELEEVEALWKAKRAEIDELDCRRILVLDQAKALSDRLHVLRMERDMAGPVVSVHRRSFGDVRGESVTMAYVRHSKGWASVWVRTLGEDRDPVRFARGRSRWDNGAYNAASRYDHSFIRAEDIAALRAKVEAE